MWHPCPCRHVVRQQQGRWRPLLGARGQQPAKDALGSGPLGGSALHDGGYNCVRQPAHRDRPDDERAGRAHGCGARLLQGRGPHRLRGASRSTTSTPAVRLAGDQSDDVLPHDIHFFRDWAGGDGGDQVAERPALFARRSAQDPQAAARLASQGAHSFLRHHARRACHLSSHLLPLDS